MTGTNMKIKKKLKQCPNCKGKGIITGTEK
jgi:DnaJ-class molecular chaperone